MSRNYEIYSDRDDSKILMIVYELISEFKYLGYWMNDGVSLPYRRNEFLGSFNSIKLGQINEELIEILLGSNKNGSL